MGVAIGTNEIICSLIGLTKNLQFFSISVSFYLTFNIKEDLHSMSVKSKKSCLLEGRELLEHWIPLAPLKKQETDVKIFVTGNRKRTTVPVCLPWEDFPWGPDPAGSPWHCQTGHVPPRQRLHHLLHQQRPTVTGYLPCWQEGLQEILRLQHWQGTPHRNSDLGPSDIWCAYCK